MGRMIDIVTLELKKKKFISSTVLSAVAIMIYSVLSTWGMIVYLDFSNEYLENSLSMFLATTAFIILIICSTSLGKEFDKNTDRIIFTGIFKRSEILISKVMAMIISSTFYYIVYEITTLFFRSFSIKRAIGEFIVFVVFSYTITCTAFFITLITKKTIITGLLVFMMYYDVTNLILKQAVMSFNSELFKGIIEKLPIYFANSGFKAAHYTFEQGIILLVFASALLIASIKLLNRKNL